MAASHLAKRNRIKDLSKMNRWKIELSLLFFNVNDVCIKYDRRSKCWKNTTSLSSLVSNRRSKPVTFRLCVREFSSKVDI